jgi:hypothetical protein
MTARNPEGAWGSYGSPGPAFAPFGWALVNANGTFAAGSGNLGMIKGTAGNYILQPLDDKGNPLHYPLKAVIPKVQIGEGLPFTGSPHFGFGPSSDGILVLTYDPTPTLSDASFYFTLELAAGFFTP